MPHRRSRRSAVKLALFALVGSVVACGYRPARFTTKPIVRDVGDDVAIPVPAKRDPVSPMVLSEAYVRRPVVEALEINRRPDAGDVNALDDVPHSSWFSGKPEPPFDGPPSTPLTPLCAPPLLVDDGVVVHDSRGLLYELHRDRCDRPEMLTAAEVIASQLLGAFGYRTPEVWVTLLQGKDLVEGECTARVEALLRACAPGDAYRVTSTRWPIGSDLGPTPTRLRRGDDPNDQVDHIDRRTQRALKLALFWIGNDKLRSEWLRDTYVGAPGEGHLRHYLVGLNSALGADAIPDAGSLDAEFKGPDLGKALVTLGLAPLRRRPIQTHWLSLGWIDEEKEAKSFDVSPPYDPMDRVLPADAYWAAKRIALVEFKTVENALVAAHFSDPTAKKRAADLITLRRAKAIAYGFGEVTPCEVEKVGTSSMLLRDLAITDGTAMFETTRYQVSFADGSGSRVGRSAKVAAGGVVTTIPLPQTDVDYLIVKIIAQRDGRTSPRAMEAHLAREKAGFRLVGLRH